MPTSDPAAEPVRTQPATRPAAAPPTRPAATQPATAPSQPARANPARLAETIAAIVELEEQGQFSQAWKLALEARAEFGGQARAGELTHLIGQLRKAKRRAVELADAVRLLDSETPEAVQIAASTLADGGPVGAILLRRTVRIGPARAAARAAEQLVKLKDKQAAAACHQRLGSSPQEPLRSALLDGLLALAGQIPPAILREYYAAARNGSFADHRRVVEVLAAACRDQAGASAEQFGRLLGDPEAWGQLRGKATAGLASKDKEVAAAAARVAAALGIMRKGFHGSYYDGKGFEKLLFERLDSQIDIADQKLPYPDGRQDNRSIRWTGQVRIPVGGEYTFYPAADDGVRLWVGDKKLIDRWTDQALAEYSAKVTLTRGLHPIKLEYYQGSGQCGVRLSWRGPGIDKQLLTATHLVTLPWKPVPGEKGPKKD